MAQEVIMGKIVDEGRMVHEQNTRPLKLNSLTEEVMWCVKQGLRSMNVLWTPWNIMLERKGPRQFKIVAWFPENHTMPNGYHRPMDAIAFYHVEDHPIDSFMDVNFWPISRELAKQMVKKYKGE